MELRHTLEWNRVDVRLPEMGKSVLLYAPGNPYRNDLIILGYMGGDFVIDPEKPLCETVYFYSAETGDTVYGPVTHWAYIDITNLQKDRK